MEKSIREYNLEGVFFPFSWAKLIEEIQKDDPQITIFSLTTELGTVETSNFEIRLVSEKGEDYVEVEFTTEEDGVKTIYVSSQNIDGVFPYTSANSDESQPQVKVGHFGKNEAGEVSIVERPYWSFR